MNLKETLDNRPDMQAYLFCRGFLVTDQQLDMAVYPFYGNWSEKKVGAYHLYHHKEKKVTIYESDECVYYLIGHAYDPFSLISDETELLKRMSLATLKWEETNTWTGIYCVGIVTGKRIQFTSDAAGQQLIYYGIVNGKTYITSHSQVVAEIERLEQNPYIVRLKQYRFFHKLGLVLPGDLSPLKELTRAQCNFCISISNGKSTANRFWPSQKIQENSSSIEEISEIIHNNMLLISKKWPDKRAAISVTGGMDSKSTMACTNGLYDRFSYFSYDSLPDEKVDADAAHLLCDKLGLSHTLYSIPKNNDEIADYEIWDELLYYNCGCIGYVHPNDVRKRAFFSANEDFDIEVKSWVDEIGRARYHKRFSKKSFPPKPNGRYLSSLYKPFITERLLLRDTDKIFTHYLEKYYGNGVFELIPWWDLIYWEFEWNAAEGAFFTGEHLLSYDITIPYNNRKLLEIMLSFPLEMRIGDEIQKQIIKRMNPQIEQTGIHVQDVSHTAKRALLERAYLEINTRLPF